MNSAILSLCLIICLLLGVTLGNVCMCDTINGGRNSVTSNNRPSSSSGSSSGSSSSSSGNRRQDNTGVRVNEIFPDTDSNPPSSSSSGGDPNAGKCSGDGDCPGYAPYCSKWGYCQENGGGGGKCVKISYFTISNIQVRPFLL